MKLWMLFATSMLMSAACSRASTEGNAQSGESVPNEEAPVNLDDLVPNPPGTNEAAFSGSLRAELAPLIEERFSAGAIPRTRHLRENGYPIYSNRLMRESSPYLLQHAHNPVNWFPWGDDAFDLAAELDRPVFLSVGYSTCHWCHVMEEESFEDLEVAEYINSHFIAVKVDREQRPDVDSIYMNAVYYFNGGNGGWPMTVVMTPDRVPFFGATYIPARDGDRGSRSGLLTILGELSELYATDTATVSDRAEEVVRRIVRGAQPRRPGGVPDHTVIQAAAASILSRYDSEFGGTGSRPKFPRPSTYQLLLRYARRSGDEAALEIVTNTLDHMADGGIYDHLAGGFHRYSTDRRWLVPHFEKMLYDNAQLTVLYLEAFQLTDNQRYATVAQEVLDYVAREMTHPDGGFYSATDADSEGEEGTFFVWDEAEIDTLLPSDQAEIFKSYYGVTSRGNFEGHTILSIVRQLESVAVSHQVGLDEARASIQAARQLLYDHRLSRIPPGLDDKVLVSWNGLMIGAFARGSIVLGRQDYGQQAERAAEFIFDKLWSDGRLYRSYRDGIVRSLGFLDDYAFLISGLLDLFEATNDSTWLERAIVLQTVLDTTFWDNENGGYFFTSSEHESLLAREKPDYDGAEPAGNSVAAENLLRLAEFTTEHSYRQRAEGIFQAFSFNLRRAPQALPRMLDALDYYLDTPWELVFVSPTEGGNVEPFLEHVRATFLPNRVMVHVTEGEVQTSVGQSVPLVQLKTALGGQTTAYVCQAGICQRPTADPAQFAEQITPIRPYVENEQTP